MIYVDILEYLHGQQFFENVFEDVLEDVFGLFPPGPRLMVAMGHMLWAIQWAVHKLGISMSEIPNMGEINIYMGTGINDSV